MGMIFLAFYIYLNCAVDKTIGTSHTSNSDCSTNHKIVLLMMLIVTSLYKPLKRDPSRRICNYATWVKPSFAKYILE